MNRWLGGWALLWVVLSAATASSQTVSFSPLAEWPGELGVAGPVVAAKGKWLLTGGGANFASPEAANLWQVPKKYSDQLYWLERADDLAESVWHRESQRLPIPVAYSASVMTSRGLLCLGGENEEGPLAKTYLLDWEVSTEGPPELRIRDAAIPDLPVPLTAAGAARIGDDLFVVGGQVGREDGSREASAAIWRLDLKAWEASLASQSSLSSDAWKRCMDCPGAARIFPQVTVQHDGFEERLYVFGGRTILNDAQLSELERIRPLDDGWSIAPEPLARSEPHETAGWRQLAPSPVPLMAGTAVPVGAAHVLIPAAATGEIINQVIQAGVSMEEFPHPGFPKRAYLYHTITDTWADAGSTPANPVTTPAVVWEGDILLLSGEVRPRVRTRACWLVELDSPASSLGSINLAVIMIYLLGMVALGAYFTHRNRSTDDFFRGGKSIPWWAAGCSIFATMLSSITYMAIPAKAFAQDWVYSVGNLMALAVAPIAIYVALPFFRRIDATSAYEYLERRFNRTCRRLGSGCFSLFHVFRMGVVLALASLALASITPLTAGQCVLIVGGLSIVYCTLGGIEAVIWTDTIQTVVLLGGALLCLGCAWFGASPGSWEAAQEAGKLNTVNLDFGPDSFASMALWVVVLGGFGQSLASYTADQAVIQRYMTTADQTLAARSIWFNGLMAVPAAIIFFGMGTAFWMYYRSHPERLDPNMAPDGLLPNFVSHELPVGLAGLVVAGIFAAAQSTVSTSMNSGATTLVTDFLRPSGLVRQESSMLFWARCITVLMGILGTLTGLLFVDESIKSLFDQFIAILGMFLGVLAGLFALGATTRRAHGPGGLAGALVSILLMFLLVLAAKNQTLFGWHPKSTMDDWGISIYQISPYLYALVGIGLCYASGYLFSLVLPGRNQSLDGLTLWTPGSPEPKPAGNS